MPEYAIVARKTMRGLKLVFRRDSVPIIQMSGSSAEKILNELVSLLSSHNAVKSSNVTEVEQEYVIDEKLGGAVAAILLLVRRSRTPEKWIPILRGMLEGRYPGLPEALEKMLEAGVEASRRYPKEAKRVHTLLHPKVADALTSGVKRFVEKYVKGLEEG